MLECFKSTITDRWVFVLVFSLLPPVWVMIWTFSLAFVPILHQFYSLISSFSPPNHAGNLSEISFLSVWKKTCGAFIKTRIIHQVSEPSGPVSSICWTESTPPPTYWCTKLTQRDAILTAPKSFHLHFTTKLEKPADCDHRGDSLLHDTGATICSQGPNLSVVLPPSKWTYFLQKYQGRDWKNNCFKRLWQSLNHLCVSVMTVIWYRFLWVCAFPSTAYRGRGAQHDSSIWGTERETVGGREGER